MTTAHTVRRVLVVEDSDPVRATLERALARRFEEVRGVGCVADARAALRAFLPDLMILGVALPDGSAVDVMQAALAAERVPLALVTGPMVSAAAAFRLAQLGVRVYLPTPFELACLAGALDEIIQTPAEIAPQVRTLVGQRSIQEVEDEVRQIMLREALARAEGSRRTAAKLLRVSRQRVQHMLRRGGLG